MENIYKKLTCRVCRSKNLEKVLDLGAMPLANAFLPQESLSVPERVFPLAINFCNNCSLVQLSHVVNGELLFKDYRYATSASRPLVEHFHSLADEIATDFIQSPNDLVVEIGSNDGSLLARIKNRCRVLGVDPAQNLAEVAAKNNIPTIVSFFTDALAKKIKSEAGAAKVVVANNVMAHIDDIHDVVSGVRELLCPDGRFIFEVHWAGNLIGEGGFDQIYHEHLCYWSLHSLKYLLDSLGMIINDVKLVPMHGQSLRVYAGLSGASSGAVGELLSREIAMGLTRIGAYFDFAEKVGLNKKHILNILHGLKKAGKKIVGYWAPGKGNALLNYFQIGPDMLDFVTDTTPSKQGMYTPGTHIPVVSPEILKTDPPDYILLLSWNYADAILEKEKELRKNGVKFIIPVPEVRVV